jgi:hypothetical protein
MTQTEIFDLYKRVKNRDREAEDTLIALHRKTFPNSNLYLSTIRGSSSYSRDYLHTMYLHLYK